MQTPGVYVTEQQYTLNPLAIDGRCVTGFVGIAERGPLHTPTTIKSFDEYLKLFGSFDTVGCMPFAIYNYFKCGGSECVVVRIADVEHAQYATLDAVAEKGALRFTASTKGVWGNAIRVRLWHETEKIKSIESVDFEKGVCFSCDDSDIQKNDVVKVSFLGNEFFRTIKKRVGSKLFFDRPIEELVGESEDSTIHIEKAFVSLSLSYKGKSENYLYLSMNAHSERYIEKYINERSSLCTVKNTVVRGIPEAFFSKHASMGNDGIAELGAKQYIGYYNGLNDYAGLGCLESRDDISLICAPDIFWLNSQTGKTEAEKQSSIFAVQKAMVEQAERFANRFAILDVPETASAIESMHWADKFDTMCAAAYFPHIDVIDPLDPYGFKTVRLPPSGAVCGCVASTDGEKGIFHAPANIIVHGAVGLAQQTNDSEYELLYAKGLNMLKYFPGKGIKIWGARTLSSDPNWRYINVRRTFTSICNSIKKGTQWAVFETNDKNLRKRLIRQVSGFLIDLWMKGYLAGTSAEQSFYVRCDEELNPPENIDNGILTFSVGMAITKPTEFFTILITAEKEGASVYITET